MGDGVLAVGACAAIGALRVATGKFWFLVLFAISIDRRPLITAACLRRAALGAYSLLSLPW
jgi:hypothetical protein